MDIALFWHPPWALDTLSLVANLVHFWNPFLDLGLNSLFNPNMFSWFQGTFKQFYLLTGLLLMIFAMAYAMLLFFISKISKNYITMLLIAIPLIVAMFNLATPLFRYPFAVYTSDGFTFYRSIPIPFVESYITCMLLPAAAIPIGIMLRKQKRAEIA